MYPKEPHPSQENRHPNRFRVQEGNIDQFSKQYVLEGQRLKVKSILYREKPMKKQEIVENRQETQPEKEGMEDYDKLEYLEQLGVLNPQEKIILNKMRSARRKEQPSQKARRQPLQRLDKGYGRVQPEHRYQQGYGRPQSEQSLQQLGSQSSFQPQYGSQSNYQAQYGSQYNYQSHSGSPSRNYHYLKPTYQQPSYGYNCSPESGQGEYEGEFNYYQ